MSVDTAGILREDMRWVAGARAGYAVGRAVLLEFGGAIGTEDNIRRMAARATALLAEVLHRRDEHRATGWAVDIVEGPRGLDISIEPPDAAWIDHGDGVLTLPPAVAEFAMAILHGWVLGFRSLRDSIPWHSVGLNRARA